MTAESPARRPGRARPALPWTIRSERRLEVPRWLPVATTIGAVAVALLIGGVILAFAGGDPIAIYAHILRSSFGSLGVLSDTLVKATPLILTGLACALAFRMRLWNIGAEGQLLMGAWAASAIVLVPVVPAGTPSIITIPLMMVAAILAGGLYGAIPGVLKAARGVNEIIVTLMLNYIALLWISYWVFGPWSEGGFQLTPQFPREAWLPRLSDFADQVPAFSGLTVHLGLVFGLVAAVPEPARLRDPAHRRQPARRPVCGRQRRPQHDHRLRDLRRPRRPGRDERGVGRRASPPAGDLARLRLHRRHRGLHREAQPLRRRRRRDRLWGPHPRRPRDPALGDPGDDPGDHPLLPHRERGLPPLPLPDRAAGRLMDPTIILAAGVATGTVLLFAAVGEIFAERAGVLNLGVEGMMLMGAVVAFATAVATGNPWLGLVLGMLAGGMLSLLHAVITISFQAEQVVSGLALTFLGSGLARVLGEELSKAGAIALIPTATIPVLSAIPIVGPILFTSQSVLVYLGFLIVPAAWYWINRTRPGLHLRAVGESPTAADTLGVDVYRLRYAYVFVGGLFAGLGGATITLAISPGWFSDLTTGGAGWIAIAIVIFARWNPIWAAIGAYAFGAIRRMILDLQGPRELFARRRFRRGAPEAGGCAGSTGHPLRAGRTRGVGPAHAQGGARPPGPAPGVLPPALRCPRRPPGP